MIAPAWPIRLPSGAVRPGDERRPSARPRRCSPAHAAAASSSAAPPISPISTIASVSGSAANSWSTSRNVVPMIGSPPMPTQVDWPMPASVIAWTASYVSVPERRHDADSALAVDRARDDARPWPGRATWRPGSSGRSGGRRRGATSSTTGIMSSAGMPSVMQKIVAIPAPTASSTASGAPAGRHEDAGRVGAGLARPRRRRCRTPGRGRRAPGCPPLPGVTPATSGVPYSSIGGEWNSPSRPVMPWTTRRVSRPTRMLMPCSGAFAAATAFAAASSSARRSRSRGLARADCGRLDGVRARRSGRPSARRAPAGRAPRSARARPRRRG